MWLKRDELRTYELSGHTQKSQTLFVIYAIFIPFCMTFYAIFDKYFANFMPILDTCYTIKNRKWKNLGIHAPYTLSIMVGKKFEITCLKWLKMILNYPPWLEKLLKFTTLKWLYQFNSIYSCKWLTLHRVSPKIFTRF